MFISFEGIDGAGKSSHIDSVAQALEDSGRHVVRSREPGGSALAEKIRAMLLGDAMDPMTEALLAFAARRDHLVTVIEPALARGDVVICDRFTDSTYAYQGGGRGFDLSMLATLESMVQRMPDGGLRQPDLTFWFDLPPSVAARRLEGARAPDKFESQAEAFFDAVRSGYAARMHADPVRFIRIDADRPRECVRHDVLKELTARLHDRPGRVAER